jgi:hypothetical protein
MTLASLLLFAAGTGAAEGDRDSDPRRYEDRDPLSLTLPRRPVTRKDYVDFVRPWAEHYEMTPEADQWNWRAGPLRIMPPLAVFALEGDRKLGEQIKRDLRVFANWVDQSVAKKGVVFCLDAGTFCTLCVQQLRQRGLMTPEDDRWVREMFLKIRKHHGAWAEKGPWDGWWRGSQHRSQAQGINNALAAFLYPDEPDAAEWRRIADVIWGDWWNFRDVGINDMWYFHSSLGNITRAAHILGRKEVFTDPQSRRIFERILFETTPEGGAPPYGASCGYNVVAGSRIVALELAARYTGDGRYRWAAHRLMNNCQARDFHKNSPQGTKGIADIAVASLICDDSIQPVKPKPDSKLLVRKEIIRDADRGRSRFPDWGGIDCGMYMTQRVMPSKLAFRSGWEPGDLFMLVECYARHDPLNPTAIVGLERYGASMAEMVSEKFLCRENAVAIQDLSGTAVYLGKKNYKGRRQLPTGWAGMESEVPVFSDHKLATHARVDVTHYMGYEAAQRREFLFVKNGFVLVRDETSLDDAFRAEIGPTWNTQHVGKVRGSHWINTWFSAHYSFLQNQELGFVHQKLFDVPPWDLLVWHAPHEGAQLKIMPDQADKAQVASGMFPTRYAWEGAVAPGAKLQFVTVLLPHAPTRDATALASGITVLADRPGLAAVRITQGGRCELAVLNPEGTKLDLDAGGVGRISTDARAAYVDLEGGHPRRALVLQATSLKVRAEDLFRSSNRRDFETGP